MNKTEAKIMLNAGCILTHSSFSDDEFIYLKNGEIHDENGYNLNSEFWAIRFEECWNSGWEIKKPPLFEEPVQVFKFKNYYAHTQKPKPKPQKQSTYISPPKQQNNEKCNCNSGLKFKNCCKR